MHRLGLGLLMTLGLQATLPAVVQAETLLELSTSPVEQVIAYQGQGIVTRKAVLNLSTVGNYRLRITDIPLNIVGDSLRVHSDDKNQALIQNVQLMPLPPGQENLEVKQLKAQIAALQLELARNDNRQTINTRSQAWLDTYWQQVSAKSSGNPQTEAWQNTLVFLNRNQAQILESQTQVALQGQKLRAELNARNQELAKLQAQGVRKTQAAVVYFSLKKAGPLTFKLSYLLQGIHWKPSYDARLDEKSGKVSLSYYGDVEQQTGEAWQDVDLSLSTATPLLNAAVPILDPWVITDRMPPMQSRASNAPAGNFRDQDGFANESELDEAPGDDSLFAESDVQTQGLSVLFAIPQKVSIDSSPHARRVAIATRSFQFEPEYQVVPKLSRQVYLRARFRNGSDLPLLAGPIRNYVDLDYTGTSQLNLVRPNQEASLNFGVDENIRVIRKEGDEQSSVSGLMRDTRRRELSYEIEVSNFKNKTIQVVVWDHLPLVRNEAVTLKVEKIDPPFSEQNKNNLLRWNLELKPQETKKITVAYTLEHPLSMELYSNFTNEQAPQRKNMERNYQKF